MSSLDGGDGLRVASHVGSSLIKDFHENGYAIVRGLFSAEEIDELAGEFDRFQAEGRKHPKTYRQQNILYEIHHDADLGPVLQFMQWPAYISEVLAKYRVHPKLLDILELLIGNNLKQLVNTLIWKPPGSPTRFAYHQDCRFRRPASAYRNMAQSSVNLGIAIDPHRPENGCVQFYPGSHRLGDLRLNVEGRVTEAPLDGDGLIAHGLDRAKFVDVCLDPGDVAVWGPYMIHGSGPNRSAISRRLHVNGYVRAEDCDRGEWAFRNGQPCQLADPVLIQYEDLFTRPEPHYVDGPPHPYKEEGAIARRETDSA